MRYLSPHFVAVRFQWTSPWEKLASLCRKRLSIIELSATYAGDGFQKEQLGRLMHCQGLIDKVVRERVLLVANVRFGTRQCFFQRRNPLLNFLAARSAAHGKPDVFAAAAGCLELPHEIRVNLGDLYTESGQT